MFILDKRIELSGQYQFLRVCGVVTLMQGHLLDWCSAVGEFASTIFENAFNALIKLDTLHSQHRLLVVLIKVCTHSLRFL